jgi:hypothetical protein
MEEKNSLIDLVDCLEYCTVAKKGYFFRETLELLNRSSDVGDAF